VPRGRKPRTWVRLDCEGVLRGSINYLFLDGSYQGIDTQEIAALACQAIWVKMIAFSEVCGGRSGYIEDNNGGGLPHSYIARELHCPLDLFEVVLRIMSNDGAVKVNGSGSIQLVNFRHYQFSEYDRQKPYRLKSGAEKQTFEEYVVAIQPEYSDLDVNKELEKFKLWWSEGRKELKRPKSAFRNWLDKAREIKQGKRDGTHKRDTQAGEQEGDSARYKRGKYGHLVE